MRTPAETKKLINKYMKWWVKWTGLDFHTITTIFVDFWEGGMDADAICEARWEYLDHTITFNVTHLLSKSDEYIEAVIVHELMHIFLNEMQSDAVDISHEERCASQLQKAFMWVRGAK